MHSKVWIIQGNFCDDTWIEGVANSKAIADGIAAQLNDGCRHSSYYYWADEWTIDDAPQHAPAFTIP